MARLGWLPVVSLGIGVVLGAGAMVAWAHSGPDSVSFASNGSDLSAHAAHRMELRSERALLAQTCNGVCDDLSFNVDGGDDSYRVRVLDAAGREVARGGAGYVTSGVNTRLTVSGHDKLEIRVNGQP